MALAHRWCARFVLAFVALTLSVSACTDETTEVLLRNALGG
jgi:hypothetical protein